ncbi:tyrosine-protein kinase SYK-like isoform X1 [Mytilus edulis]|uniref:tyrosine-protein kinase SYK-like isoform X1 n=2 Tax=Mytilus TaxID=6548 RepID=UPI0039F09DCA
MATAAPIKPSSVAYFYGRITREEAEQILASYDKKEGLYLLRESINPLGNYAISICHNNNFHHYNIEKRQDGMYKISDGRPFPGPVELIQHHEYNLDGMITNPKFQCVRQPFQRPIAFRGMTYTELENELISKAESMKNKYTDFIHRHSLSLDKNAKMERALGAQRDHLILLVAKDLHKKQPWYHGKITRDEADKRMTKAGHDDGKFLVRQRDDKKTFALTLSYRNEARHYMIDKKEKFAIQDGPKFDCLMMLIDHYHNKSDGLLCKLATPVPKPGYDKSALAKYMESSTRQNMVYSDHQIPGRRPSQTSLHSPTSPTGNSFPGKVPSRANSNRDRALPLLPPEENAPQPPPTRTKSGIIGRPPPPLPTGAERANWTGGNWEQPEDDQDRRIKIDMESSQLEKIYDDLPRTIETFSIRQSQLQLEEELGSGQFGSVQKGYCTLKREGKIPVAVKKLKSEDKSAEQEMLKEADLMRNLTHTRIVRMIGLCRADCIMLVLELCPCGPLNSFLAKHKELKQSTVVQLMWQVAQGMAYLHSKNYVHRDLAARNVLLVSENSAKISDFGMSKALNIGNDYYKAQEAGKWPLKWYAPECVYYWKFDAKSDVWSYGVTLWEATSYGEKPYRKMKGNEILKFLVEDEKRLQKPDFCDEQVYEIMLECWQYDKKDRPTFEEIDQKMRYQQQRLLSLHK